MSEQVLNWFSSILFLETTYGTVGLLRSGFCVFDVINTVALSAYFVGCNTLLSTPAFSTPAFSTPAFSTPAFSTPAFSTPAFSNPAFPPLRPEPDFSLPHFQRPDNIYAVSHIFRMDVYDLL